MPLPSHLTFANTFGQLVNATNNLISSLANTSEYILVSQNATPQVSTGNVSIDGTVTVTTLAANALSGNGAAVTSLNASALTGTVDAARLPVANTTANGILTIDTQSIAGDKTLTGSLVIVGNLTVEGTTTHINSNVVDIGDAILTLNADLPSNTAPTEHAGLEINRGSSANTTIRWNESSDTWEITRDGSTYGVIPFASETANASTITTGIVGTTVGGTGLTGYTIGDLIYASSSTVLTPLTVGASGTVLWSNGTVPSWTTTPTLGGLSVSSVGTATTTPSTPGGGTYRTTHQELVNFTDATLGTQQTVAWFGMKPAPNASWSGKTAFGLVVATEDDSTNIYDIGRLQGIDIQAQSRANALVGEVRGARIIAWDRTTTATGATGILTALVLTSQHTHSANITTGMYGSRTTLTVDSPLSTIAELVAHESTATISAGNTISGNVVYHRINALTNSGTITGTTYGLYVGDITTGTQTGGAYSIYNSDANAPIYNAGAMTNAGLLTTSAGITNTGTVTSTIVNATSTIQLNGVNISTAGTLNNVAYLNATNTFSVVNYFTSYLVNGTADGDNYGILTPATNTGTGSLKFQAGAGSSAFGGGLILYSHANVSFPGWVKVGISTGSGGKFSVNTAGLGTGTDVFTVDASGNVVVNGNTRLGSGAWPTTTVGLSNERVGHFSSVENGLVYVGNMVSTVAVDTGGQIHLGARKTTATLDFADAFIAGMRESGVSGTGSTYMTFNTAGSSGTATERMRIDSNGFVGLGVVPSTARLEVKTSASGAYNIRSQYSTGVDAGGLFESGSVGMELVLKDSSAAAKVQIATMGLSYLMGGNVGIGTTSPATKLHLYTSASGQSTPESGTMFTLESSAETYMNLLGGAATQSAIWFGDSGDANAGGLVYDHSTNAFSVRTAGVANRLVVDSSGNVGIGTTAPGANLGIYGGSSTYLFDAANDNSGAYSVFGIQGSTASESGFKRGAYVGINVITDPTTGLPANRAGTYRGAAIGFSGYASGKIGFFTGPTIVQGALLTEVMRIDETGYVGIGTTSPLNLLSLYGTDGTAYLRITDAVTGNTSTDGVRFGYNAGILRIQNYETTGIDLIATTGIRVQDAFGSGSTVNIRGNSTGGEVGTSTNHPLYFVANAQVYQTILADGKVGIGITTPYNALHVSAAIAETAAMSLTSTAVAKLSNTNNTAGNLTLLKFSGPNNDTSVLLGSRLVNAGNGNSAFVVGVRNDVGVLTEQLTMLSTGYVGIGVTAPTSKLHVVDSTSTAGYLSNYTALASTDTGGNVTYAVKGINTASGASGSSIPGGGYFVATNSMTGTATGAYVYGVSGAAITSSTRPTTQLFGVYSSVIANSSVGTVALAGGFQTAASVGASSTISDYRHVYVTDVTGTGTVTVQYGVYVPNLTKGATNYSVYTGAAQSYFGGAVSIVGNLSIGTNPSTTGAINLANSAWIYGRNAANSGDVGIARINASNQVEIGGVILLNGSILTHGSYSNTFDLASSTSNFRSAYLGTSLNVGTNPSTAGGINLANSMWIYARNQANSADVSMIKVNTSNALEMGPLGTTFISSAGVLSTPMLKLTTGTASQLVNFNDLTFLGAGASDTLQMTNHNGNAGVDAVLSTAKIWFKGFNGSGEIASVWSNAFVASGSYTSSIKAYGLNSAPTTAITNLRASGRLYSAGDGGDAAQLMLAQTGNNANYVSMSAWKTRAATTAATTAVTTGDSITRWEHFGADGTAYTLASAIYFGTEGTIGTSQVPGNIVFYTHPNSTSAIQEVMRLSSAGYVGIGTSSPSSLLHLYGTGAATELKIDNGGANGDPFVSFALSGTQTWIAGIDDDDSDTFKINATSGNFNTTGIAITTGGNVGIGTTAPGVTAPPTPWTSSSGSVVLEVTSSNDSRDSSLLLRRLDLTRGLDLWQDGSTGYTYIDTRHDSDTTGLIFRTKTAGAGPLEAMSILGSGKVGIGTTAPTSTLHVVGNMLLTGGYVGGYVAKTATYTIVAATDYVINCTANTFTVTLPTAVGFSGQVFVVKNTGAGVITVNTTSSQTIDGALTQTLVTADAMTVMSDGANWIIL